jgi:signal transduction histidine kinase
MWALRATVIVSGAAAVAVVALAGGTEGGRFGFLLAFPAVGLVLLPEVPGAIGVLAATCFVGGLGIALHEGRGAWFLVEWSVVFAAITLLGFVGAVGYRRLARSELAAQRSRLEALLRLAESERHQTESDHLASLGRLVSGVAHDINNPLTYVRTSLEALLEEHPELARSEALSDARHGVGQIVEIVSELRGQARAGASRAIEFSIEAAVVEAWRIASPKLSGLRASWTAEPDLPTISGSQRILVQALVNLIANAAEAASGMTEADRRWVRVKVQSSRDVVAVIVDDGGPGLPSEIAAHLFEPFNSTKGTNGTGLGLALVRDHVGLCGGTVEGGNRPDGGARFIVRLPVAGRASASTATAGANLDEGSAPAAPPSTAAEPRVETLDRTLLLEQT